MGFLDNIFNDNKKKSGGNNSNNNNNNNNNNPLANIRRNIEQLGSNIGNSVNGPPRMTGTGQSLGGAKPGTVIPIILPLPGPLGVRVEKRSNNSASSIVNAIVPGSQAESSGLQRGDVLCFAGSDGQNEMPYEMFLQIAKSTQRPIQLEARRFDSSTAAAAGRGGGTADAEGRRRAMIAAAEAREKKHKKQTKSIKYVTKSTLAKQQQQLQDSQLANNSSAEPQTEASRRAAEAAKRGEANLAAELGYNPYESIKKTAGQARAATTTTQHGTITAPGGGGGGGGSGTHSLPVVAPPRNPTSAAEDDTDIGMAMAIADDPRFPFEEFEVALATVASSNDVMAAKSGLKIARKLITNATTKGQLPGNDSEKFRKVRLANPKIKAALVDVPGNTSLMLSVGFELHPDDSPGAAANEFLLVFPPACKGPKWLSKGLTAMETIETSTLA